MADDDSTLTAFSPKALGFAWLGMLCFGFVNFFVFNKLVDQAGTVAGTVYLGASIIVAALAYAIKWRGFAIGILLGFTLMTLVDGTCTLWTRNHCISRNV